MTTEEGVLPKLNRTFKMAEEKEDPSAMLQIANSTAEILGMFPKKANPEEIKLAMLAGYVAGFKAYLAANSEDQND
jgi:hypothetical protein